MEATSIAEIRENNPKNDYLRYYSRRELVDEMARIQSEMIKLKLHESKCPNVRNTVTELIDENEKLTEFIIQRFHQINLMEKSHKSNEIASQPTISEPLQSRQSSIIQNEKTLDKKSPGKGYEIAVRNSMRDWSQVGQIFPIKKKRKSEEMISKSQRRFQKYKEMCQTQICHKNLINQCQFGDRCWRIHSNKDFGCDIEIDVDKPLQKTPDKPFTDEDNNERDEIHSSEEI